MVAYLTERGYKIQRPSREVSDRYTFDNAWNLYEKKVGCKDKLRKKWNSLPLRDRKAATEYIPSYVLSTPDRQYRKNFQTFLNQRGWEDEIVGAVPPPAILNEESSSISQLIQKTKASIARERQGGTFEEERKRLVGIVEMVRANPQSLARKSLEGYYKSGYLQRHGILWHP